jgi:hypothetical protein
MDRKNFNLCLKISGSITLVILLGFIIMCVVLSHQSDKEPSAKEPSAKGHGLVSSLAPRARGSHEGESEKDKFLEYLKKPLVFTSAWFRQLAKEKPNLFKDPSLSAILA